MSDDELRETFIEHFHEFIDAKESEQFPAILSTISKEFDTFQSIHEEIFEQFRTHLKSLLISTQEKTLLLVEYLSTHNSQNFLRVISDKGFLESLLELFSKDEFITKVLNILKLWSIVYEKDKEVIPEVFTHIESLEVFGLSLPKEYKSNIEFNKSNGALKPKKNEGEKDIQAQPRFKITSFIDRCSNFLKNSKTMLENNIVEKMLEEYQIEIFEGLLGNLRQLLFESSNLKLANAVDEIKEAVEKSVKGLKSMQYCLQRRYDLIKGVSEGVGEVEEIDYLSKVNSSKIEDKNKENIPLVDVEEGAMSLADLKVYKTHPCRRAIDCPHHDSVEELSDKLRAIKESKCSFWHSDFDRRRPIETDAGSLNYSSPLCFFWINCNLGDGCKFSHNYFEENYHPYYYKNEKCSNEEKDCLQGKYCPYYHSKEEKETWAKILNSYFKIENEDALENDEAPRVLGCLQTDKKDNKMEIETEDKQKIKEISNPVRILPNQHRHANIPLKPVQVTYKPQECKGKLNSKLIVRKVYENPSVLTNMLLRSSCFNGIPFLVNQSLGSQNNSKN